MDVVLEDALKPGDNTVAHIFSQNQQPNRSGVQYWILELSIDLPTNRYNLVGESCPHIISVPQALVQKRSSVIP
jgi:hypothetical protein